ncbi:MAG: acyltransferase [Phocaeicola sp.]
MNIPAEFDEIRPYSPEELPQVFEELIADPAFRAVIEEIMPQAPFEVLADKLRGCKTNLDMQKAFCHPLLWDIVKKHGDGLTFDHTALKEIEKSHTYISNHRDIILDSAFLCILLIDLGLNTVEIAIGDNLLIYPWIKKLVRVNKSFIVKRAVSVRQKLESSALMSRYMHFAVNEKQENLWIAQRQGRAKDSSDRTQDSILKMMVMGGEGDIVDRLTHLNLVPLAISYEYDPCDYLKATELQQKRDNPDFVKSPEDDLINMNIGLYGYKGKIHFQTAHCLNEELQQMDRTLPKGELFSSISSRIDQLIHSNYRIYPGNYVAFDLLNDSTQFIDNYTEKEKTTFENYLEQQLNKIELTEKDIPFLREKMLVMYANPLINYLATQKA